MSIMECDERNEAETRGDTFHEVLINRGLRSKQVINILIEMCVPGRPHSYPFELPLCSYSKLRYLKPKC